MKKRALFAELTEGFNALAQARAGQPAETMRLSAADQACFAQALLSPPPPPPALERAFVRRRQLLRAAQ